MRFERHSAALLPNLLRALCPTPALLGWKSCFKQTEFMVHQYSDERKMSQKPLRSKDATDKVRMNIRPSGNPSAALTAEPGQDDRYCPQLQAAWMALRMMVISFSCYHHKFQRVFSFSRTATRYSSFLKTLFDTA
jgi:hypothetical protein